MPFRGYLRRLRRRSFFILLPTTTKKTPGKAAFRWRWAQVRSHGRAVAEATEFTSGGPSGLMHLTADRRGLSSVVVDNNLTMATWRFERWLKNAGQPQPSLSPDLARSLTVAIDRCDASWHVAASAATCSCTSTYVLLRLYGLLWSSAGSSFPISGSTGRYRSPIRVWSHAS